MPPAASRSCPVLSHPAGLYPDGPHRGRRGARAGALVAALLAVAALGAAAPARATDYVVEVVLFETLGGDAGGGGLWFPKSGPALGLAGDAAREAGFALLESDLSLEDAAARMRASGRYRVLRHFAWRQPGLDARAAKAIRVNVGQRLRMYLPEDTAPYDEFIPASAAPEPERPREIASTTVAGTLKVRLGRFLHLESLLVFTDAERGESFRLSESRKMRSRELHYIDNPRFGLLTRILPIEEDETAPAAAPSGTAATEESPSAGGGT